MTTKEPNELPDDIFAVPDSEEYSVEEAADYAETQGEQAIEDESQKEDYLVEENEEDAKEYYEEISTKDYGKYDDENAA
jgi:hypothetical protein